MALRFEKGQTEALSMVGKEGRQQRRQSLLRKLHTLDGTASEGVVVKNQAAADRQARANLPKSAQSDGKVTDSVAPAKSGHV